MKTLIDLSSRQKIRTTNDIFEMILENDDDIQFDEYGVLKIGQHLRSSLVSSGDCSTPEISPTFK